MTYAMRNMRLIARLDVKKEWLIKGVQMEGWRKVGDPAEHAKRYVESGADELLFMDVVASLYQRNSLAEIVERVASNVFVPMTVGGGIRNLEDVGALLACGADKVAINTAAIRNPALITSISDQFGSQATVLSVEAMRRDDGGWEAMTDNGRNHTGRDVVEWAAEAEQRGAGEIVLSSIDRDGTGRGYDLNLVRAVSERVSIPVVASGGLGTPAHLTQLIEMTSAAAAAVAQGIHWNKISFAELRTALAASDCYVRELDWRAAS